MKIKSLGCFTRVSVSTREVEEFKSSWPCSGLPDKPICYTSNRNTKHTMNYFIITSAGWKATPSNKFIAGRTALQNSVEPQVSVSQTWQGKDALYREYRIWQNEGWSRSFLQKLTSRGWEGVA